MNSIFSVSLIWLPISIFILIVLFLILRAFWLWYWKVDKVVALLEKIEKNTRSVSVEKSEEEKRRDKIIDLIKQKGEIANNDVQQLLGVSDATATRYLDYLEKENLIVQIGETGSGVRYKLK